MHLLLAITLDCSNPPLSLASPEILEQYQQLSQSEYDANFAAAIARANCFISGDCSRADELLQQASSVGVARFLLEENLWQEYRESCPAIDQGSKE